MARQHMAASIFDISLRARMAALTALAILAAILTIVPAGNAQTFTVLHNFTGGLDGANPHTGLTMDRAGNLYGTAQYGGSQDNDCHITNGCGAVFKLARGGSGWIFTPLYQFQGFPSGDGSQPFGRVIIGRDGSLYGTTVVGGRSGQGCGVGCDTVFKLSPQPTTCKSFLCGWQETLVYSFTGAPDDGASPQGEIAFDAAGNLYGATAGAGNSERGTVFELTPSQGGWTETVFYNFQGGLDGSHPLGGVALDQAGNLYGTTDVGGEGDSGTVFQLAYSGSGWMLNSLHSFGLGNDGIEPVAGVILDQSGNLYGATGNGTPNGDAVVFEMSPSNEGWTYNILYTFVQSYGGGPAANLVMDAAGNVYGTTIGAGETGNLFGNVFKLTPSNGGWIYTDLHDFTGGADGAAPYSSVVIDSNGNLYGTATVRGANNLGVVWEITP